MRLSLLTSPHAGQPATVGSVLCVPAASTKQHGSHSHLRLGTDTLPALELCRSATATFSGVEIVSTHGGDGEALARAAERLGREGRRVLIWSAPWRTDAHAGRSGAAPQLALAPETVRLERAEAGDRRCVGTSMPALKARGQRVVSPNGVLGDPTCAAAADGEELLGRMTADLVRRCSTWLVHARP